MTYIVKLATPTGDLYLRGTVWGFSLDRATHYPSPEVARQALETARKFMEPATYKAAKIVAG